MSFSEAEIAEHSAECDKVKSMAGEGPWQDEPNRLSWKAQGLDCLIVRNVYGLHLCGYVGVPPSHPLHGKHYNDVDADVHGGLTFADKCNGPICHEPADGEPDDVWWLGFDCAHMMDLSPGHEAALKRIGMGGSSWADHKGYRDIEYVKCETERLASQLVNLGA